MQASTWYILFFFLNVSPTHVVKVFVVLFAPSLPHIRTALWASSCVNAVSASVKCVSVGADRLLCVILTAIVWFGLVLEVFVHVHLILAIDRLAVVHHGTGLQLHVVSTLNDGNGRLRADRGAGALWRHLRWGCGVCHGEASWVDHTGAGGDGNLRWLAGQTQNRAKMIKNPTPNTLNKECFCLLSQH